ncbi:MAG: hypothetical protein R8K48_05405 [Gallionella sp.]
MRFSRCCCERHLLMCREVTNEHGDEATSDDKTRQACFPHLNPREKKLANRLSPQAGKSLIITESEKANEHLRELHVKPIERRGDLPTTAQLLIRGGDERIALNRGINKYGCTPYPDEGLLALGSSTASVISRAGFEAANVLREALLSETGVDELAYERTMERVRLELLKAVSDLAVDLVFAASGTDAHNAAVRLVAATLPLTVVMVEESETGSGVRAAMQAALRERQGGGEDAIKIVPLRLQDGMPRARADIDAAVTLLVRVAITSGRRVLLVMVDQSKTGMIAPSPACVAALHQRHSDRLNVLVDGCQFRLAPVTLRRYLALGFMVALTGSKFLTGPSFSAVLLFPVAQPSALEARVGVSAPDFSRLGLLLRWEAALTEYRRFRDLPHDFVVGVFQAFAQAVQHRLMNDVRFELLIVPPLDRRPLLELDSWDCLPSIFSFLIFHSGGGRIPFSREETQQIYRQVSQSYPLGGKLAAWRCQLGQPVACGRRDGIAVSALRLSLGARLISEAFEENKVTRVIEDAMRALDKTAWLIDQFN